jgi:hypothetical protein
LACRPPPAFLLKIQKKNTDMKNIQRLFLIGMGLLILLFVSMALGAQNMADVATVQVAGFPFMIFLALDVTKLADRTEGSRAGGGYTSFRFAPKSYLDVIPNADPTNKAKITSDFVFKAGKGWIYIYTTDDEFDFNETASDVRSNEGYVSELKGVFPGENTNIRQFINEGISSIDGYVLLDNCNEISSIAIGKGKCCPGTLKINFKSGKKTSDMKGWEFTFKSEQEGVSCHYEGVGAMNQVFTFAADDATPDVSHGTAVYRIPANTAATAITALDNAVVGSLITLEWTSATNASTIANGATFQLAGAFTPAVGAKLVLQATTASTFAERYREIPV